MAGGVVTIGRATLYLGDCRDILPTLGKVDAVVTDPPYGISAAKRGVIGTAKNAPVRDYGKADWDNEPISPELLEVIRAAGVWSVIFGGNFYHCAPASCWLVWDKCNTGGFADCELAWTNLPKAVRRIRYMWNGMIREQGAQRGDHPTQKPLEVMRWCIGHLPEPNETILDPFMGSGTTGVAAVQMGRSFIGIEREPRYFEAACRRIREANGDDVGPLFIEAAQMLPELTSIAIMAFGGGVLIDEGLGVSLRDRAATASRPSLFHVSGIAGIADAKSPPAETFERGGTGAAGGRGALNAQQLGDACNKSRPLGLDH